MPKSKRLAREQKTVEKMIALYCRGHHNVPEKHLCSDCQTLLDYSYHRIDRCPFGSDKPTCAKCTVHCYRPEMREQIRQVMRYAGPRMILHHPRLAVMHFLDSLQKPA